MLSTVQQINVYVLEGLNKANAGTVAPDEFDVLINGAMLQWVKNQYERMEANQRSHDSVRKLIVGPAVIGNAGAAASQGEVFPLPYVPAPAAGQTHGYMHMLNVAFKVMKEGPSAQPVACRSADGLAVARPLRRDAMRAVLRRPFHAPSPEEPYYMLQGESLLAFVGAGHFASEASIHYLRYPIRMSLVSNLQPELAPDANQEIADLAIRLHLERMESRRHQTLTNEQRLNA